MQRAAFVMVLADWDRGRGNTGTEKLRSRWKAYTKSQQNCSFIFWQDPDQIRILFLILQGSEQTSHQAGWELQRFEHWQVGLVSLFKAKNSSTESTLYLFFSWVGAVICTQRGDLHGRAIYKGVTRWWFESTKPSKGDLLQSHQSPGPQLVCLPAGSPNLEAWFTGTTNVLTNWGWYFWIEINALMPGWHNSSNLNIIGTWNLWNFATAPICHPLPRQPRGLAHGPGKVQRLRQARPFSSDNEAEFFNEKNWKAGSVSMISNLHMGDVASICLGWQGADHSLISSQDAINGYTASAQRILYCSIA